MTQKLDEDSLVITQDGNNWSVFVFRVKYKDFGQTLSSLWESMDSWKRSNLVDKELMAHFTVRQSRISRGGSLVVSLRVYRERKDAAFVEGRLRKFFRNSQLFFKLNPSKGTYARFHRWIPKGKFNAYWTMAKCCMLSLMSRTIVGAFQMGVFSSKEKFEWAHLWINMLGLQEACTSSTKNTKDRYLVGFVDWSGGFRSGLYLTSVMPRRWFRRTKGKKKGWKT